MKQWMRGKRFWVLMLVMFVSLTGGGVFVVAGLRVLAYISVAIVWVIIGLVSLEDIKVIRSRKREAKGEGIV